MFNRKSLLNFFSISVLLSLSYFAIAKENTRATLISENEKLIIDVRDQQFKLDIISNNKKIIALNDIYFNETAALKWTLYNTTDNTISLIGEFPAHVDFYALVTDTQPRMVTLTLNKVNGGFRINAEPTWGRTTSLHLTYLGDHFFGLSEPLQPDNQLSPDLTGSSINVDINSEDAYIHENYATAYSAFYISSFGYGSFFDSFARGRYDFAINGKNRITHDTGKLDWYIFPGKDGVDIQKTYYSLIGAPKTLPIWSLGPMGWRDQNNGGAKEILDDVKKMRELKIPFTSWFVDRPYADGAHAWSKMNFNSLFANPEQWIKQLREQEGVEFMTWTATATFGDTNVAKHLQGKFSYLDLTDTNTVEIFQKNLAEKQHAFGVKGHKIDRADEAFPVNEDWADVSIGIPSRRNQYSYLMAKVHDEALRKKWGDDQITFARSAYQRSQPYLSAIWGGDPRTSWEGLQANFANAMRASFMGFPVWGTDVGGYQGEGYIPENLYIRWMQAGSMTGLFEIKLDGAGGAGKDRMPWRYDEKFQKMFRSICNDRMTFLPYLYSLANTSATNGAMMQPLAYRHVNDKNTYDIHDQFYLGKAILVAPVMQDSEKRKVYLPQGNWIDFNNTAMSYTGGKTIEVQAPLDTLPRFIAENSIFVTGFIYQGSDRNWIRYLNWQGDITITATPSTKNGSTQFDYVDYKDGNKIKAYTMKKIGSKISIQIPKLKHDARLKILIPKEPTSVLLNNKPVEFNYDRQEKQGYLYLIPNTDNKVVLE
ncbi:MAG: glycoside hydrolase family 31 protein [Cellvibrio sp.]|nr:glycoside hydrolase family 31 protein [Cellvibrio sp.]